MRERKTVVNGGGGLSKLNALLQRRAELVSQLDSKISDEQRKEASKARKRETQVKILVGAAIIANVNAGKFSKADTLELLRQAISRQRDIDVLKQEGWWL